MGLWCTGSDKRHRVFLHVQELTARATVPQKTVWGLLMRTTQPANRIRPQSLIIVMRAFSLSRPMRSSMEAGSSRRSLLPQSSCFRCCTELCKHMHAEPDSHDSYKISLGQREHCFHFCMLRYIPAAASIDCALPAQKKELANAITKHFAVLHSPAFGRGQSGDEA